MCPGLPPPFSSARWIPWPEQMGASGRNLLSQREQTVNEGNGFWSPPGSFWLTLRLLLKRSKVRIRPRVSFLPFNLNSCSECKKAAPEGSGEAGGVSVEALRSVSVFLFITHDRPVEEVLWGRGGRLWAGGEFCRRFLRTSSVR